MNHTKMLQTILDYIDNNLLSEISATMIAEKAGYSAYHFSRIFSKAIGISVMSYVTWRRLQYSLYDLSRGKKVIDVAMDYGFETHGDLQKRLCIGLGFRPHYANCA